MAQPAPPALISDIQRTVKTLEGQNHYERLGVDRSVEPALIRKAYMTLAAKWHPDRFSQYDLGPHKVTLQRLFGLITESNTVLNNPAKREEYNASLDMGDKADIGSMLNADSEFRFGVQILERGQLKAALARFENAAKANPSSLEYQAWLLWTRYALMPKDESGRPSSKKLTDEAVAAIQAAIQANEKFDMGYVFWGQIVKDLGDVKEARKHFNTALSINAKNFQAQRQLRLINMRGDKEEAAAPSGSFMDRLKAILTKKM